MKILIFPDIHGRKFWSNSILSYKLQSQDEHLMKFDKIVFLGDYLDPYYGETDPCNDKDNIDEPIADEPIEELIQNLKNIIEFKKEYPDKVVLLLGNHDMHYKSYYFRNIAYSTRFSLDANIIIKKENLFSDANGFQTSWQSPVVNGHSLLCTHAGINEGWWKSFTENISLYTQGSPWHDIAEFINAQPLDFPAGSKKEMSSLFAVGYIRGGDSCNGGPFWSDFREMIKHPLHESLKELNPFENVFQIFGHTQLKNDPFYMDTFACIDCRRPFIFDVGENELYEADGCRKVKKSVLQK